MIKTILLLLNIVIVSVFTSCNAQPVKEDRSEKLSGEEKVEVYYFHYTRRCATCLAVENESKKALEELYPEALEQGKISFTALNLEEPESKSKAEKLNVAGQTLLVIMYGEQINLTNEGFMYARTDPDKLQQVLHETIGDL